MCRYGAYSVLALIALALCLPVSPAHAGRPLLMGRDELTARYDLSETQRLPPANVGAGTVNVSLGNLRSSLEYHHNLNGNPSWVLTHASVTNLSGYSRALLLDYQIRYTSTRGSTSTTNMRRTIILLPGQSTAWNLGFTRYGKYTVMFSATDALGGTRQSVLFSVP